MRALRVAGHIGCNPSVGRNRKNAVTCPDVYKRDHHLWTTATFTPQLLLNPVCRHHLGVGVCRCGRQMPAEAVELKVLLIGEPFCRAPGPWLRSGE
jgi:hypothetical protein